MGGEGVSVGGEGVSVGSEGVSVGGEVGNGEKGGRQKVSGCCLRLVEVGSAKGENSEIIIRLQYSRNSLSPSLSLSLPLSLPPSLPLPL